jgi:hypothetical protein
MLLMLGLLVASVTSCTTLPNATAKTVPTIADNGTVYHPYTVDASSVAPGLTWTVQTPTKREHWTLNQLHTLKVGDFIWYSNAKYRVLVINRNTLTMSVSWPLDCCASQEG